MAKENNRIRILTSSIELFNQQGVAMVTTNHIAKALNISPGNLYFHFSNKEEIIRELFDQMCNETYEVWRPLSESEFPQPFTIIEKSFEVFWKFRFFHREMYHLRRRDPLLARKWRQHIGKIMRLLKAYYAHWVKNGVLRKVSDPEEMQMISDFVLITSSSFLQFYESPHKPASRRSLRQGTRHILRFLLPYHTESGQRALRAYLQS